jgi:hypothetical protein
MNGPVFFDLISVWNNSKIRTSYVVLGLGNNCVEPGTIIPSDWTRKPIHGLLLTDFDETIVDMYNGFYQREVQKSGV